MHKGANRLSREDRNSREGKRRWQGCFSNRGEEWGRPARGHRAATRSGNSLIEGCICWGLQIQLALSQCRLGIRWQSSYAKAPASHADRGSRSSISEIFSGQITREAETRSTCQAGRELHFRTPFSFARRDLWSCMVWAGRIVIQILRY